MQVSGLLASLIFHSLSALMQLWLVGAAFPVNICIWWYILGMPSHHETHSIFAGFVSHLPHNHTAQLLIEACMELISNFCYRDNSLPSALWLESYISLHFGLVVRTCPHKNSGHSLQNKSLFQDKTLQIIKLSDLDSPQSEIKISQRTIE